MSEATDLKETVKRLGWPIGAVASALALFASLKSYGESLGWKIVAATSFVTCLGWALWYISAMAVVASQLEGAGTRREYRHGGKIRFLALLLPIIIGATGTVGLIRIAQPHYAAKLFEGGGPYSPILVFDSVPAGADVRIARIFYGEDDPTLTKDDIKDHVLRVGPTPCRVRVDQGQYWVVFERRTATVSLPIIVTTPVAVRADFSKRRGSIYYPDK